MTHEETSLQTRKCLSAALKRQMERKPLRKITVNDIITDCGLNRKTFYYHFEDIYALLKWSLEQDIFEVLRRFDFMTDVQGALQFTVDYIESNAHLLNCIYDTIGRDEIKRLLCDDLFQIVRKFINENEVEHDLHLSENSKEFLCRFYSNATVGTLVDWFRTSYSPETKQFLVENLSYMLRVSLPETMKHAASLDDFRETAL